MHEAGRDTRLFLSHIYREERANKYVEIIENNCWQVVNNVIILLYANRRDPVKGPKMMIVIERLKQREDGSIVNMRREISYKTAERMVGDKRGGRGSTLEIFALVYAGCDHNRILADGRMVYESSLDSTTVYLEAEVWKYS